MICFLRHTVIPIRQKNYTVLLYRFGDAFHLMRIRCRRE